MLLIDFWATWCPPCIESVPDLKRLNKHYAGEPFTLLSVSVDRDEAAWREFIEAHEMDWEQYRDSDSKVVGLFLPARFAIPTYIVVDGDGIMRTVVTGDGRRTISQLRRTIEASPKALPGRN